MTAPPPNPALDKPEPRSATALSAVFRRIVSETPAPPAPVASLRPAPVASSGPQLLGFAEPVAQVPPIEDFLPAVEVPAVVERVEIAALEPELELSTLELAPGPESKPKLPEPELPESEPEPELPEPELAPEHALPVRARVRDLPTPVSPPAPVLPERPQNLVGRLGRRLGEVPPPAARHPSQPAPAARLAPEPAPKLTTPAPTPVVERGAERGGRPSLPRNRRLYRRASLPAEIEIDGAPCTLIDVSIGGFAATGVPQIEPDALVPVMIRLVIDGIEVGTLLKARIMYVTQGRSSGRFIDLSPSQMAFLRYIVTWRGESVGAVGTTTLLDAIASGVDRGFSPGSTGRSEAEPKSRWWAGFIGKKVEPPR